MIRHTVLLRFAPDTSEDIVADMASALRGLPVRVPQIRGYQVGTDLGLREGTWDLVVIGDFDSPQDFAGYLAHPDHQAVVQKLDGMGVERVSVQFESA
jgi:hypothetical protein